MTEALTGFWIATTFVLGMLLLFLYIEFRSMKSWHKYEKEMEIEGAKRKLLRELQQIDDLYREFDNDEVWARTDTISQRSQ